MKALASILLGGYFLLGSFMPGMDFCELLKIPELIGHFHEHKQLDRSLNFIEFISGHYGSDNSEPADEHQLPFKDHHCCASHTHSALITQLIPQLKPTSFNIHSEQVYSFHFTSPFLAAIWQPPQFS